MPFPSNMDATWMEGAVSFNAQELRRADSGLFIGEGTNPLGVYGGIVRHNDNSLAVTVSVSDVVTVQPGAVVIPGNSGTGNGVYRSALAVAETGNLAARSATLPRIDLVVYRAMDTSVVAGHGAYTGRIEIIAGTPAASPVAPALPALAVELARITVPISGGAAATVDSTFRTFAAAIGGILPVATAARLPTAPNAKWLRAVTVDTGLEYVWNGTAWEPDRAPRGTLGYAQITSNVATTVAYADTPGLSTAVTVGAGRRIRITAEMSVYSGAGAGLVLNIYEGATLLQQRALVMGSTTYAEMLRAEVILTPTVGAHTYKVGMNGTSAGTVQAGANQPAFILVEDIGAV